MNFVIAAAYQWQKEGSKNPSNNSEMAIKQIIAHVNIRFKPTVKGVEYKIDYRRLRASAGKTMLDSIIKRIEKANVVIIDITHPNPNVFLELGIAIYYSKQNPAFSFYLIKEKQEGKKPTDDLPSDLQGLFITQYSIKGGKVSFDDGGSLRMSIIGDVKEYYNNLGKSIQVIDEINED
jgi:hypothetical protein